MIEDFKVRLYCSIKNIKYTEVKQRYYEYKDDIDSFINTQYKYMPENEYGFFFENAFPSKDSRGKICQ